MSEKKIEGGWPPLTKPLPSPPAAPPPPRGGMFSQQELSRLVEQTVPPERNGVPVTNAIVGVVDSEGVALVVQMKKGEHWTVEMAVKRDWGGDVKSGAKVMWSW